MRKTGKLPASARMYTRCGVGGGCVDELNVSDAAGVVSHLQVKHGVGVNRNGSLGTEVTLSCPRCGIPLHRLYLPADARAGSRCYAGMSLVGGWLHVAGVTGDCAAEAPGSLAVSFLVTERSAGERAPSPGAGSSSAMD